MRLAEADRAIDKRNIGAPSLQRPGALMVMPVRLPCAMVMLALVRMHERHAQHRRLLLVELPAVDAPHLQLRRVPVAVLQEVGLERGSEPSSTKE